MGQVQQFGDVLTTSPSWTSCANQNQFSNAPTPDALMVVLSAIMGLLAGLLLIRSLVGRLSGGATVRFFLWAVFALLLPLTTYMFSEAKKSDICLHWRLILLWMLLAELLRKKLDGASTINASPLQHVNKQSTWDAIDQIVRIAWIGYLIYYYMHDGILMFVILWAFSIIKVAQRVAAVEVAKRSFALGKNSHLVAGYVRQLFAAAAAAATGGGEDQNVMTECKYVIMGEDNVKTEVGPQGYSLKLSDAKERDKMVTVGDVWQLVVSGDALFDPSSATEDQGCLTSFALCKRLRSRFKKYPVKDLCLSFALYKLLRRRFEGYPSAEAGRPESLHFLLCGLLGDDKDKDERVFRVIEDELNFLGDYYFSTIPLMLSNLWFFPLNCLLMLVIPLLCCIVIITSGVLERESVLLFLVEHHATVTTLYDLIITLFLIATLFLLESAEAVVYVHSDWVMVSLLCTYAKKPSWQRSARVRWALTTLRGLKTWFKHPKLKIHQHSHLKLLLQQDVPGRTRQIFSQLVLRHRFHYVPSMLLKLVPCRRFLGVRSMPVPKEVKAAIVKYLIDSGGHGPVPPIGKSVLRRNGPAGEMLLWACESDSAAETIIVWHIATCLYEMKHPRRPLQQRRQQSDVDHDTQANRSIAETLSKYCAYLVALAPELLPDDADSTATAYKAAAKKIQDAILNGGDHKANDCERVRSMRNANGTAAVRGVELGHQLVEAAGDERWVWKVLAELWTEIVVYIAPSDDVKSHAQALAHGGEFITHIWALLSHGGILRWPAAAPLPADQSPAPDKSAPLPADQSPV